MPDDKKKQAMSLLFGDAPARPEPPVEVQKDASKAPVSEPVAKTTSRQKPEPLKRAARKRAPTLPPQEQEPTSGGGESVTPDPYYQGASRYRRQSGEQVKHSVYLDPDVSRALKVAAALGEDPRGTNVSAIVNGALRELGYGA